MRVNVVPEVVGDRLLILKVVAEKSYLVRASASGVVPAPEALPPTSSSPSDVERVVIKAA
jgi:hypothetical protein